MERKERDYLEDAGRDVQQNLELSPTEEIPDGWEPSSMTIRAISHGSDYESLSPERQELHKSPEQLPEKEPGGPFRPSRDAPHAVPAHVIQELDDHIAKWTAENDSRIQERELTDHDLRILKGDAGEGRTYVDLLERYDRERILHQPRFREEGKDRNPDFAVVDDNDPEKMAEMVDSKAWSVVRPKDADGKSVSGSEFSAYLQKEPAAGSLLNTSELKRVVENYSSCPRLASDGKVVLYFPEEVVRHAPQIQQEVESWSGTDLARGHGVEVRSMGVWQNDLWKDVRERLKE